MCGPVKEKILVFKNHKENDASQITKTDTTFLVS